MDYTQTHNTLGRTPVDNGSASRRNIYVTTKQHSQETHPCRRRDSNPQSQQASGFLHFREITAIGIPSDLTLFLLRMKTVLPVCWLGQSSL